MKAKTHVGQKHFFTRKNSLKPAYWETLKPKGDFMNNMHRGFWHCASAILKGGDLADDVMIEGFIKIFKKLFQYES